MLVAWVMRLPVAALATSLALLAPATASAAQQTLSASGHVLNPTASVLDDGSAVVDWGELTGGPALAATISSAPLPAGGATFGAASSLYQPAAGDVLPAGARDGTGRAQLCFERRHAPYRRIRYVAQQPDGSFSAPVTLSPKGHSVRNCAIAVAADGAAAVSWSWFDGHAYVPQVALKPAGGAFGAPVTLPGSARFGGFVPALAVSPNGHVAVLTDQGGVDSAATGTIGGGLGPVQTIGTHRGDSSDPVVAVGDDGTAVATFVDTRFVGSAAGADTAYEAIAPAGGTFAHAAALDLPGDAGGEDPPAAVVASDGTAIVVALAREGEGRGGLFATTAGPGQAPSAPARIASTGTYAVSPDLAADAHGGAALTYTVDRAAPGGRGIRSTVELARRPAGGAFGAPVALSDPTQEALRPSLALGADGNGVVAWTRSLDGSGEGDAEAAVLPAP